MQITLVQNLELTKTEEGMLHGKHGPAKQKAMEILVALGKIYGAEYMVKISSAQISGVSYKTIGNAGLDYLKHMAALGGRVEIPSFLNPAGVDTEQWQELGFPEEFAKKQIEILDAYSTMGIQTTCTCTPYLIGIRPPKGEHIAWSESSAVSFANSVLGAMTNREGGPSALCAALTGVTPAYGLHLKENRIANLIVNVEAELKNRTDYSVVGLLVGKKVRNGIPAFKNIKPNEDQLKYLSAAMAASGSVALYFVKDITPEWNISENAEEITITQRELDELVSRLNEVARADLIATGCPHASMSELEEIKGMLREKPTKEKFWICLSRKIKEDAEKSGLAEELRKGGATLVADTCMVVAPLEQMGIKSTGVNSGKATVYLPTMCHQKLLFGRLEDILWK